MNGRGGGRDIFSEMDRMMDQMMGGSMMGRMGMGMGMGMGMFDDGFGGVRRHSQQADQRSNVQHRGRHHGHLRGGGGPVIEEPDDFVSEQSRPARRQAHPSSSQELASFDPMGTGMGMGMGMGGFGSMFDSMQQMGGGGGSSFSFSSSSTMVSNGQVQYSSTTTTRRAPSGAIERQSRVSDGRTGTEEIAMHRELGGRSRTVRKSRLADGTEETTDTLNNMTADETSQFDQDFSAAAGMHRGSIGNGHVGNRAGHRALPSSGGRPSGGRSLPRSGHGQPSFPRTQPHIEILDDEEDDV